MSNHMNIHFKII